MDHYRQLCETEIIAQKSLYPVLEGFNSSGLYQLNENILDTFEKILLTTVRIHQDPIITQFGPYAMLWKMVQQSKFLRLIYHF